MTNQEEDKSQVKTRRVMIRMLIQLLLQVHQSSSHKRDQIEVPPHLSKSPRKTRVSAGRTTCWTTAQCQIPAKLLLLKRQSKLENGNRRDKGNSSKTHLEGMEKVKKTKAHLALTNQANLVTMVRLMVHQLLTRSKRKARSHQKSKVNSLQVMGLNRQRDENQIPKNMLQLCASSQKKVKVPCLILPMILIRRRNLSKILKISFQL